MTTDCDIREIAAAELNQHTTALAKLLIDAVDDGASVGFIPPLSEAAATAYWQSLSFSLQSNARVLLAAFDENELVGSVQLQCASMPNSVHRAEVMKLLVLRKSRYCGLGTALMLRIHEHAVRCGRTLLIADTRVGSPAQRLCNQLGYVEVGVIPRYARSANGKLDSTVIMYRWLEDTR
jgi:acetyltransferase